MKFNYSYVKGAYQKALEEDRQKIALAATAAVKEAGDVVVSEGRQDIGSAGFSGRWQSGLTARMTNKAASIDASVIIFHKIGFAGIFEEGATILGKPLLWLPIEANLPPGRWTPKKYAQQVGPLRSLNRPGRKPLLISAPRKLRPEQVRRRALLGKVETKPGVPLFVGVESVTIRKRFHIGEIAKRAASRLKDFYDRNLKA